MTGASSAPQGQGDNLAQTVNILMKALSANQQGGGIPQMSGMGLGNMGGTSMMGGSAPSMAGNGMGGSSMGAGPMGSSMGAPMGGSMGASMGGSMGGGSMGGGPMGSGPMGDMSRSITDMSRGGGGGYSTSGGASGPGGPRGGYGSSMGGRGGMNDSAGPFDTIIIRNLPLDCNWQVLRDGFSNCGEIKFVEMKERGTGIIRFASSRDAERAVCKFYFIFFTRLFFT